MAEEDSKNVQICFSGFTIRHTEVGRSEGLIIVIVFYSILTERGLVELETYSINSQSSSLQLSLLGNQLERQELRTPSRLHASGFPF